MTKLQALVEKRKSSFVYLKKTHEGGCYWLNCVQLNRKPDLEAYAAEIPRARTTQLFYLGLSLARLLQSGCGGAAVVRGALQLFEEWEYHFAGNAAQSVRGLMAKVNTQTQGQGVEGGGSASGGGEDNNPVVARLCKFGSEMVYEHLLTPPLPFALDYFEVFFSLCDIICQVYNKLMEEECYSNVHVFEALVKVDAKVKRHVLNVTAKEFTEMSAKIARSELAALR
ncbi:hypothetical protein JKP88DRAFT_200220 [Tribonema minus]|uniref:Uncharacterized protein n=1 Tax=Tribonema minus TaxID=303371 RepID=A0A836CEB8_9STRA|nr:hypothetical protein JKP88DRAFT_200220 [Tribonema minus]